MSENDTIIRETFSMLTRRLETLEDLVQKLYDHKVTKACSRSGYLSNTLLGYSCLIKRSVPNKTAQLSHLLSAAVVHVKLTAKCPVNDKVLEVEKKWFSSLPDTERLFEVVEKYLQYGGDSPQSLDHGIQDFHHKSLLDEALDRHFTASSPPTLRTILLLGKTSDRLRLLFLPEQTTMTVQECIDAAIRCCHLIGRKTTCIQEIDFEEVSVGTVELARKWQERVMKEGSGFWKRVHPLDGFMHQVRMVLKNVDDEESAVMGLFPGFE